MRNVNRMKLRNSASVLALMVLPTVGCEDILFDDPEHVYNGPPVVEFAPVLPAGNYTRPVTLARSATADTTITVRVNYVAAAPASNVSGEITRVSTSTAVEGTHYRFTSGSQYTIQAGSNFVDVPIEVLAAGLAAAQTVTLVLELAPGNGFQVSEKYKRFTLTLRRL
jgi:hypothetical protein